ncbi:MAG TPA: signal peptidase I [Syntrophomonadaceae bacterium]|nr:signal peptidase I [Syntrophomonadaceae bacterium]
MINSQKGRLNRNRPIDKGWKVLENVLFVILMAIMSVLILVAAQSHIIGKEPSILGYRIYIVSSGSMHPTIKTNSVIVVRETEGKKISEGDIVTYYGTSGETRVTHRVIEINENHKSFVTKGDANKVVDPLPLEGKNVIGKVAITIPYIGVILRLLATPVGITLVIIIGMLWIFIPVIISKKTRTSYDKNLEYKDGCL